jgi:hypothetical protein
LLLSIVPSTLQKPVVFSWRVRVVTLPELEDELLDELELLEELVEPVVELELEEELDELLLEVEPVELLELAELELEELLVVPPLPVQVGAVKLPS